MESPFVIPVVAIVMAFSIPIVAILVGYAESRHKTQVRLKAIEKGVPIPLETEEKAKDPYERMATSRRKGIIATMVGLGIFFAFAVIAVVTGDAEVLCAGALGLIPLFIGIGLFIDSWLRRKDLEKLKSSSPSEPTAGAPTLKSDEG